MATTFEYNTANVNGADIASGDRSIAGLTRNVRARFAQYRAYRATLRELESLSRRELNDLGLDQYRLNQIAYDTVYGANT